MDEQIQKESAVMSLQVIPLCIALSAVQVGQYSPALTFHFQRFSKQPGWNNTDSVLLKDAGCVHCFHLLLKNWQQTVQTYRHRTRYIMSVHDITYKL